MTLDERIAPPTWADSQIHPDDMHADPHPFDAIDTTVFVGAVVEAKP